jgi:hypothetical protein
MSKAELKAYLKEHPRLRPVSPAERRQRHEEMLEELALWKYCLPYDTPEEQALVREIHEWEQAENGGYYIIRKQYRRSGRVPVLTTGDFPSQDFVEMVLWERYGGGTYLVYKGNTPRILARYEIDGPSWFRPLK